MSQPASKSASALGGGVVVQKQKAGVYTVLLALSLVAVLIGCGFLYAAILKYERELTPTAAPPAAAPADVDEADDAGADDGAGADDAPMEEE